MKITKHEISFWDCLKYALSWGNRHQRIEQELLQKAADKPDRELKNAYAVADDKRQYCLSLFGDVLFVSILMAFTIIISPVCIAFFLNEPLTYSDVPYCLLIILGWFIFYSLLIAPFYLYYRIYSNAQEMILHERA